MIPEFVFIAAGVVVVFAAFLVLRQDKSAYASDLRSKIGALDTHLKQRENLLRDNGKNQSRYQFLKSSCNELTQKETRLNEDIIALEPRAGEIAEKVKSLTEEKANVEASLHSLEEDKRKWEDRIKELDRLDEIIGETVKKQNELNAQIEETEEKVKATADKLKQAEEVEAKLEGFRKDLGIAETMKNDLNEQAEKLRTEKLELAETIEKLQKELEDLENRKKLAEEIQVIAEGISSGSSEKPMTKASFDSLFKPEFSPSKTHSPDNPEQRFKGFGDYLEKNSYDFSDRLINAFHTSLKVQDVSCLTVMAGISGTGKSALPRLYADYMGLHFLLMPVEPRWDSPQDLFGFLNYMENRYEATPLGRALTQFNQRDKAKNSPMQDEMLLVLLDEMNLARIEYYFSEFLSRLEARRDLDWKKDPEDYQKVSLEIFAGDNSEQEKIDPIRLFAGPNVLFVGTMNEDESTQSLTDKVIDRSNVIHFGRPENLKARTDEREKVDHQKICHSSWSNACRPALSPNSVTGKLVDTFIGKLNEHFDALGRPFGHRAYSATCAYIANHPKGTKDDLAELVSLSDQIVLRFLPKLRGIDLNEQGPTLSRLRAHLATLNDEAVLKGFDAANDKSNGYFQWKGIDWSLKA
jgi:predicted  nucleic acid-binding Zn-ribbon protein